MDYLDDPIIEYVSLWIHYDNSVIQEATINLIVVKWVVWIDWLFVTAAPKKKDP